MKRVRTFDERGASIVELALILPVMALLVMGVLDLGRGYQLDIRLENAAREGAAFAQIYPNNVTCGDAGNIRARAIAEENVLQTMPGFDVEVHRRNTDGTWSELPDGCSGSLAKAGDRIRVQVHADFDVVTPIVERVVGSTIAMSRSADVRVQG